MCTGYAGNEMRWPGDENGVANDGPLIAGGVPNWGTLWPEDDNGQVVVRYALADICKH